MKHVLVLAYYFPPFGLSGVQRILKFAKYLPEYGWQPTIVTTEPHAYLAFDDSLMQELESYNVEVWRTPVAGAFSLVKNRTTIPLATERLRKVLSRTSQLFFVPDNKIGWKKAVLNLLARKNIKVFDVILSTAPPFSSHLAGVAIKKKYNLPLVVDFRDSWLDNPYTFGTPVHRWLQQRLEQKVMYSADAIISTNPYTYYEWLQRYPDPTLVNRMNVIEQGFDPDDFMDLPIVAFSESIDKTVFVYTGIFYEDHTPVSLYAALQKVKNISPTHYEKMVFHMIGYVQDEYRHIAKNLGVDDRFVYHGYVEHRESVAWLMQADVAWITLGGHYRYATVSPGKIFEYLGSGKPILGIVGAGYSRSVLEHFSHTFVVDSDKVGAIADMLIQIVNQKSTGTLPTTSRQEIERYDRRHLTGQLAGIFNSVISR